MADAHAAWDEVFDLDAMGSVAATALIDLTDQRAPRDLSYAWLSCHAQLLADALVGGAGLKPQEVVAVLSERNAEAIAGTLAIWRACAVYLPLESDAPAQRTRWALQDSRPACVLVSAESSSWAILEGLNEHLPTALSLETGACLNRGSLILRPCARLPKECTHLMYTSGSTGRPKAVMGSRAGLTARFQWGWETHPFAEGEVCMAKTALTFVDSLWEIFGPLGKRVPLVLVPTDLLARPAA